MDTTGDAESKSATDDATTQSALADAAAAYSTDAADRAVRLAVLEAENRQLREEYARARQATYRRTAIGLFVVGLIGLLGGLVFVDARTVLFALGGTGVFAGLLTYVLTPERFVSARVGARVIQALRADRDAIIDELALRGDPVYVPADPVRLFVPRRENEPLPAVDDLADTFVVPEHADRGGVAFCPTGEPLFEELTSAGGQPTNATPEAIAGAVADALVELFELADGTEHSVDTESSRVTFEVDGAGLGDPTAIDHPIPSLGAVALARTLETPVRVTVTDDDPLTITYRYGERPDVITDTTVAADRTERNPAGDAAT